MRSLFFGSFVAVLVGGGLLVACGDSSGTGGTGGSGATSQGGDPSNGGTPNIGGTPVTNGGGGEGGMPMAGCGSTTEITAADFIKGSADGVVAVYTAIPAPGLGDAAEDDNLGLELYGPDAGPFDGDLTGSFDLATGGDENYASCSRCIRVVEDPSVPGRVFFQTGGTLEIDAASDQLNGLIDATLTDVTLIEVTIDEDFVSTPVDGGECLHIASATITVDDVVPPEWLCNPGFYGTDDGCDCGCGIQDPDCPDLLIASCEICNDTGSCSATDCPGTIDPVNNAACVGG